MQEGDDQRISQDVPLTITKPQEKILNNNNKKNMNTVPEGWRGFSPGNFRGTLLSVMDVMGKFRPSGRKNLACKCETEKGTKGPVE